MIVLIFKGKCTKEIHDVVNKAEKNTDMHRINCESPPLIPEQPSVAPSAGSCHVLPSFFPTVSHLITSCPSDLWAYFFILVVTCGWVHTGSHTLVLLRWQWHQGTGGWGLSRWKPFLNRTTGQEGSLSQCNWNHSNNYSLTVGVSHVQEPQCCACVSLTTSFYRCGNLSAQKSAACPTSCSVIRDSSWVSLTPESRPDNAVPSCRSETLFSGSCYIFKSYLFGPQIR